MKKEIRILNFVEAMCTSHRNTEQDKRAEIDLKYDLETLKRMLRRIKC